MDFDIVVTMLVSWAVAKLHKVAGRVDEEVDNAIDAGVDRLHDVVAERLGGDKALETLELEAAEFGETSDLTKRRVVQSLEKAVQEDPSFGERLASLLPQGGVVIGGDVHAEGGSLAAGQITGDVTFQPGNPTQPGR
jgi:hypothetical protein